MIKDSINIEGLALETDWENLSLNHCKTYDCNVKLTVNTTCGIKDIYQVSLNTTLDSTKIINLKDSNLLLLKGTTNYKILSVENTPENNINYLEEKSFFNASFFNQDSKDDNIDVYIIDALFNLINSHEIYCSLTYLFVFDKNNEIFKENDNKEDISKYGLIDITKEFC